MPNQRNNRRRPRRGVNYRRHLGIAAKALQVAYGVKRLLNVEYKSIIKDLDGAPNSTGSVTNLTSIGQGDTASSRDGNKIRAVSLKIKGNIAINGSANSSIYRLVILRDNNGSTTPPTIASLYTDASTFFNNKNKLGDPQTNSRFTILSDTWYKLNLTEGSATALPIDIYIKMNHHVFFTGAAGTDEGKGHIYALQASNEAANDPIVIADAMFKWIDN